eukprot:1555987-Pleurochrysis_carterae.AAC.1
MLTVVREAARIRFHAGVAAIKPTSRKRRRSVGTGRIVGRHDAYVVRGARSVYRETSAALARSRGRARRSRGNAPFVKPAATREGQGKA